MKFGKPAVLNRYLISLIFFPLFLHHVMTIFLHSLASLHFDCWYEEMLVQIWLIFWFYLQFFSSMRYVTFLAAVDGVPGVKVTRVLSMPLKVATVTISACHVPFLWTDLSLLLNQLTLSLCWVFRVFLLLRIIEGCSPCRSRSVKTLLWEAPCVRIGLSLY